MPILFCISAAVFGFQALLTPTISYIFAGVLLHVILPPSWFALGSVFIVWSFLPSGILQRLTQNRLKAQFWFGLLSLVSIIASLALLRFSVNQPLDAELNELFRSMPGTIDPTKIQQTMKPFTTIAVLCSTLPFVFYALFLAITLHEQTRPKMLKLISCELIGLVFGMVSACLVLDLSASWPLTFGAILVIGTFGCLYRTSLQQRCMVLTVTVIGFFSLTTLEPTVNANLAVRDFQKRWQVTEIMKSWNTYAKVQTFEILDKNRWRRKIALGGGTGLAKLEKLGSARLLDTVAIALSFQPKSALVLYAGAGAELISLQQYSTMPLRLIGVELNPAVIEHGKSEKNGIANFLDKGLGKLIQDDTRRYLERTHEKFDSIIFSYAGATLSQIAGTITHTTQNGLTHEAIAKALQHLNTDGTIVFTSGSKINILSSLKALEKKNIIQNLSQRVLLIADPTEKNWAQSWDSQILIYKNGDLNLHEIERLKENLKQFNFSIVLSPFTNTDFDFVPVQKFISSKQYLADLNKLNEQTKLNFHDVLDDRPFAYNVANILPVLSCAYWKDLIFDTRFKFDLFDRAEATGFSIRLTFLLLVAFLILGHRRVLKNEMALAICIGLSSSFINVALTYRTIANLGNPTYAIIASVLGWSGGNALSAYCSGFIRSIFTSRFMQYSIIGSIVVLFYFCNLFAPIASCASWPLPLVFLTFLLIALVMSFFIHQVFYLSIAGETVHSFRFIGIEAISTGVAIQLAPLIAENFGFVKLGSIAAILTLVCWLLVIPLKTFK